MFEAMLRGWRAQQTARGLREDTIAPRDRLVRRFLEFTNEYPWNWGSSHVEEWTQSLVAEQRLAPSTIRGYQTDLRLFSEYLCHAPDRGWGGPAVHPGSLQPAEGYPRRETRARRMRESSCWRWLSTVVHYADTPEVRCLCSGC